MRHVVCVIRHARARIDDIDGVLTDRELTRQGEQQAYYISEALKKRFELRDIQIDSSNAKRAKDTARLISEELGRKSIHVSAYMNFTIAPFHRELRRYLSRLKEWHGVHVLITHFAFLDAAFQIATSDKYRYSAASEPPDYPYGSMVIIDVDAQTVEFLPNDQS